MTPEHELDKIAATECLFVLHGVKHGHSYRSQECTFDLIRSVFESSSLAKAISCGRTKARAIACNVLGPYFTNKIINDLLKAQYYSLSVDASNKVNCKTFPFVVQYFSEIDACRGNDFCPSKFYICVICKQVLFDYSGLIEFINDPDESAIDIFNNICKIIDDYKLQLENLTSYGADNTNVDFEKHHSVFQLLKNKVHHTLKGKRYIYCMIFLRPLSPSKVNFHPGTSKRAEVFRMCWA